MSANGKSLITKEERGFIKIVAEEESGVIVGAQMMCARATDMIGEFVTAVANKYDSITASERYACTIRLTMKESEKRLKSWKAEHPCNAEEKEIIFL